MKRRVFFFNFLLPVLHFYIFLIIGLFFILTTVVSQLNFESGSFCAETYYAWCLKLYLVQPLNVSTKLLNTTQYAIKGNQLMIK